jgi:site-specific recombinase
MSLFTVLEGDATKLVSVFEAVVKDVDKGLVVAAKYLPEAAGLAELLFPAQAVAIASGVSIALNVTNLLQNAIAEVEQKSALIPSNLTGAQKSADVLQIVSTTVIADLATLKITANTAYVQSLINAICAILNIPSTVAA